MTVQTLLLNQHREKEITAPLPRSAVDPVEQAWLKRAQKGEIAAFDWLITHYRERVVRLAAHVLRRPSDAEDLAQEAFLRAFSQITDFRGDCAFYTWLYRIVVRLCLNRMRTPVWRRETEMPADGDTWLSQNREGHSAPSDNHLLIEDLLDRLSPPLRAALVLREVEGLEYMEIADALQIPVGTVRSRLSAAREQFRSLWQRTIEETDNV
ncbi:MAG TPA: sigma-70 family RNA polymerase sigma factor [Chthonomonadaceae bacterium]|nr:sigma-70 family RNA polymerase sigma factor [Chthonomonadaceae bacterium]